MNQTNTTNERPTMSRRRKVVSALAVIAIAAGAALLPATPAAAETYVVDCYGNPENTGPVLNSATITITADGPADPVAPGETFSLTNLTVSMLPASGGNHQGFLTVVGQEINLGFSNDTEAGRQWGPMTRTLTAPTEIGEHDIEPEGNFHRIAPSGFNFYCPFGEDPDPFASVEVADVDPTPTTTTTVPANGNGDNGGDNGNGNGGDPQGETEAEREARTQAELEAELQAEAEALEAELATTAAEAALLVGATPRFTG